MFFYSPIVCEMAQVQKMTTPVLWKKAGINAVVYTMLSITKTVEKERGYNFDDAIKFQSGGLVASAYSSASLHKTLAPASSFLAVFITLTTNHGND